MTNWQNISDDEFDKVFRSSSENHEEPLWPDAWDKMSKKLDEKDKKRRVVFWWPYAAGIFVGMITFYLIMLNKPSLPPLGKNQTQSKSVSDSTQIKSEIKNDVNLSENQRSNIANENIDNEIDRLSENALKEKQYIVGSYNKKITKNSLSVFDKEETNPKVELKTENAFVDIDQKVKNVPFHSQANEIEDKVASQNNNNSDNAINETEANEVEIIEAEKLKSANESIAVFTEPDSENSEQVLMDATNINKNKRKILNKFSFQLGASPDYSTVALNEMQPLGYNILIGLEYKISNRLKIDAAFIRSLKLYDASAENYTWPANWGKPSSKFMGVSAACNMLDLPIGLKYEFSQRKNAAYFATMGITNYYMIKEKYNYHYENNSDPNLKWKQWEGSTGFFRAGVLNFSLGLEREINDKLKIQIEPFVKIPFKEVGFGNVMLYSSGLFLNVVPQNVFKKKATIAK